MQRHVQMATLKAELEHAYQNFNYAKTNEEINLAINDMILVERKIKRMIRGVKDSARRFYFSEYLSVDGGLVNRGDNVVDYGVIQHLQATQGEEKSTDSFCYRRGQEVC